MPKLYEYQGKQLLKSLNVPVPQGDVASTTAEVGAIARQLAKPVVIKAQVGVTGRFQAGGIKFADNAEEAETAAAGLIGKDIKGLTVEKFLVEEKLAVKQEMYASVVVNDSYRVKSPVLMFSTRGGTGIEEIAAQYPEQITSTVIWSLMRAGIGITTALHVGAEPVLGSSFAELLSLFEEDEETKAVVLFGEIGTVAEEEAAEVVKEGGFNKPLVTYISERTLPAGIRFSHASAIIEGGRGTAESKVKALEGVGAHVVESPQQIATTIAKILKVGEPK